MDFKYTLEDLNDSIITSKKWPLLFYYEDFNIKIHLINSQIYWEEYYGYLFTERIVNLWITPLEEKIILPIRFIKKIIKGETLYTNIDITNDMKIIDLSTIEIPYKSINKSIYIQYIAYGFISTEIEEKIISKSLLYIKEII